MITVSDSIIFSFRPPVELEKDIHLPEKATLKINLYPVPKKRENTFNEENKNTVFDEVIGTYFIDFEVKTLFVITDIAIYFDEEGRFKDRKVIIFDKGETGLEIKLNDRIIYKGFVKGFGKEG